MQGLRVGALSPLQVVIHKDVYSNVVWVTDAVDFFDQNKYKPCDRPDHLAPIPGSPEARVEELEIKLSELEQTLEAWKDY